MAPPKAILKKVADKGKATVNTIVKPKDNTDLTKKAVNIGLGAVAIGAAFFIGRKIYKETRKNRSEKRFTPEGQQALLLRSAMNPWGVSWLRWMDGTEEENIYNVAAQITNFKKVAKEYQSLFNRPLVQDLQKELKTEEYEKFMAIVNNNGLPTYDPPAQGTGKGNKGSGQNTETKVILVEKPTRIYEKLTWFPLGSLMKVGANTYIPHPPSGTKEIRISAFSKAHFTEVMVKTNSGGIKTLYIPQPAIRVAYPSELVNLPVKRLEFE